MPKRKHPASAFSGAAKGDWAATKAYYRMIDQPEDSAVNLSEYIATSPRTHSATHEGAKNGIMRAGRQ